MTTIGSMVGPCGHRIHEERKTSQVLYLIEFKVFKQLLNLKKVKIEANFRLSESKTRPFLGPLGPSVQPSEVCLPCFPSEFFSDCTRPSGQNKPLQWKKTWTKQTASGTGPELSHVCQKPNRPRYECAVSSGKESVKNLFEKNKQ